MTITFEAKKLKNSQVGIYIRMNHDYKRVERNSGIKVHKSNWDAKRKTLKGHSADIIKANERLTEMKYFLLQFTSLEEAKVEFDRKYREVKVLPSAKLTGLCAHIKAHVDINKHLGYNTLRKYTRVSRNINLYCEKYNLSDDVNKMTKDEQTVFFSGYIDFLCNDEVKVLDKVIKKPYQNASVLDDIKKLKSVFASFEDLDLKADLSKLLNKRTFKVAEQKQVYCTPEEISALLSIDCLTVEDEEVRDCSIFQAFTGLRHNELFSVCDANIHQLMIEGRTFPVLSHIQNKSKKRNNIPLNSICLDIIEKWRHRQFRCPSVYDRKNKEHKVFENCLLPVRTNQHSNRVLHKLCRAAKINELITEVKYSGNKRIETTRPKYELVTTHSMRHSFAYRMKEAGKPDGLVAELMGIDETTYRNNYRHTFGGSNIADAYDALEVKVLQNIKNANN